MSPENVELVASWDEIDEARLVGSSPMILTTDAGRPTFWVLVDGYGTPVAPLDEGPGMTIDELLPEIDRVLADYHNER